MFTRIALLLIVIIAVPYYWLLTDPGPTSSPARAIDIARLRRLANGMDGPRPIAIQYAAVATENDPGTLLVAGGGLKSEATAVLVWRLVTPGGDTVINTGMTGDQAAASGYHDYHPAIQATANTWLRNAARIVFSSEDMDDVGGLIALLPMNRATAAKVVGNPQQVEAVRALAPVLAEALAPPLASLTDPAGYAAIGPGIAAVRTPGHLPGSQMIYVRLQDGREYLFAGDTVPMRRNVDWLRPRSRYAAEWLGREDRAATLGWIKGLAALGQREPGLTVVYGHDLGWLTDPVNGPHFSPAGNAPLPADRRPAAR